MSTIPKFSCFLVLLAAMFTAGCASKGKIHNKPVSQLPQGAERYSLYHHRRQHPVGETFMVLAFSGGGTRAAALSYGVLEELRDTGYQEGGVDHRLLDEVDSISSVSGGSFTSAYYGLFGDRTFEDFKDVFLYKDVQGELSSQVFGFLELLGRMFTSVSRTETAIDYYDRHIFQGKTFADMQKEDGPFILINASDLNSRSQFIFIQPQFDFLCSDLSQFKVARAVAASSAVPILFPPILVKKHEDCEFAKPDWLTEAQERAVEEGDLRLQEIVQSLNFYLDKENPPFVTLLDGGVTDNLGLRTLMRNTNLSGGVQNVEGRWHGRPLPKRAVVILVNASTNSDTAIGRSRALPSAGDVLTTVTDMQLHRYNTETNALLKQQMKLWGKALSNAGYPVTSYFIELDMWDIEDSLEQAAFNRIPTSFSLTREQADMLIETAKRLLRKNPEYQRLLNELGASNSRVN